MHYSLGMLEGVCKHIHRQYRSPNTKTKLYLAGLWCSSFSEIFQLSESLFLWIEVEDWTSVHQRELLAVVWQPRTSFTAFVITIPAYLGFRHAAGFRLCCIPLAVHSILAQGQFRVCPIPNAVRRFPECCTLSKMDGNLYTRTENWERASFPPLLGGPALVIGLR